MAQRIAPPIPKSAQKSIKIHKGKRVSCIARQDFAHIEPGRRLAGASLQFSGVSLRAKAWCFSIECRSLARSADACGFSRIGCSTPWCTRSDSGAGGGRPADAAQEVLFPVPASPASFNSAGASERSACQPRQRLAKGDAASIRRSIPLSQEGVMRPGGYTGDPKFHVVDYAPVANGVKTIADGRKNKKWTKIHRSRPCIFRKKSGRIIARKFGIINKIFCGSHGTEGRPGQIGGLHSHGSEAVCNRGIISHGKIGAKILLISGGVIR